VNSKRKPKVTSRMNSTEIWKHWAQKTIDADKQTKIS